VRCRPGSTPACAAYLGGSCKASRERAAAAVSARADRLAHGSARTARALGANQLFMLGQMPVTVGADALYYVVRGDYDPHWGVRSTITLVLSE